jgi:hypothetical protein
MSEVNPLKFSITKTQTLGKIPAFAYDRVSSEKQADSGNSLAYQSDNAKLYAERAGLPSSKISTPVKVPSNLKPAVK